MLDTKLKNNKRFSFIIAGILVALAVLIYMASYPVLKKQMAQYYTDSVRSNELLYQIYQSNLVLYKDIFDKVNKENHRFADLYMDIEEVDLSKEAQTDNIYFEEGFHSKELKDYVSDNLNGLLDEWKSEMLDGLAKGMDYLVIEETTGEILKNTGRDIEKLYDGSMSEEENPYVYFVKLTYDNVGNLSHVSVRDQNPDELLKNVQSIMASEWLRKRLNERISYFSFYWSEFYVYDNMGNPKKLTIRLQETPKNVTFIYALTKEQMEKIDSADEESNFLTGHMWNEEMAYYEAGAGQLYAYILLALGVLALLLTKCKSYCLHLLDGFKMHLEISVTGIICLLCFTPIATNLMIVTNNGYFSEFYGKYLEFLPTQLYPVTTGLLNVFVLALLFGGFYYFMTTFGEVFPLGIKDFMKERSLIVQFILWFFHSCRNKKEKLKEELLHVDLNKKTDAALRKIILINYVVLAVISFLWAFGWVVLLGYSAVLYFGIKKYIGRIQEQYGKLLTATESIAEGNLNTLLNEDWGIFESYKEELNKIQNGFRKAVNEEVKSQRMKTELITNVSHDLKTPLTAITTYIELLEDENITNEQRREYLEVLKKKSARLKFLIEDLFEVSKANSGNVVLNPVDVDICNLMRQVYLEYEDKVEEADLIFRFSLPEEKVLLKLDSQKTYRVFENLYINIIKYAMPHTRVYVNGEKTEKGIRIELKNMSASELNIPPEDLTERFVRGDSSRNTEGSGLGLAIARSFVELQGGRLKVEIDGDLFKVVIEWQ